MSTPADAEIARQRNQSTARIALALGLTLLGVYILEGFLRALAWAVILAIATWPLYRRARRRMPAGPHDILLPLLFTAVTGLAFAIPLVLIGVEVGHEARMAAVWIRDARTHGVPVPDWLAHLPAFQVQAVEWWQANLANPAGASALIGRLDRADMLRTGRELGTQVAHRGILFGFALLTLFFLFRDGERLAAQMLVASRRLFGPHGETVARQVIASVHGTVDGMVLVGVGVGIVLGIAYAVAGVPHPALLGVATAIAAVIPLGAPIVLGLAGLLALVQGSTIAAAVLVAFGMAVIFIADHAVRPALIGGATKLPFLWVLLGILGGVETFGLLGLFLGPAVMAALILLWRDWTDGASIPPAQP